MSYASAIDLVRAVRARITARGLDQAALFAQAGLDESECIADDALTLSDKLSHLWELATQASGDAQIGLKVSTPQPLEHSGLMGQIMRASPDVRTAIDNLVRYTPLVSPAVHSTIERQDGRTRVSLDLPGRYRRVPLQHYDFVWCTVLRTLRCAAECEALQPVLVTYAFPRPENIRAYEEAYGCPVRFEAASNAMEFADQDIALPLRAGDLVAADWALRMLADLAQSQREWTRRMLARLEQPRAPSPSPSFGARVQQLLAGMLANGEPLREDVARNLLMSERTLQRRLAEEGTNFSRLVDDTRRAMAQQYLSKGELSLKKLSFQLGFSEPSAFCRACKRWFGVSPSQLQQGAVSLEVLIGSADQPAAPAGSGASAAPDLQFKST